MCLLVMIWDPCQKCIEWLLLPLPQVGRDPPAIHLTVPQPFQQYGGTYSFRGLAGSHQSLCLPYSVRKSLAFPGSAPPNDSVNSESVVGVEPGDSAAVIGYQVDEFTHTCLAEHIIAHSYIYPGFMDKVSPLTHLPHEAGCKNYSILDQAVAEFEHGLNSILIDSCQHTRAGCIP